MKTKERDKGAMKAKLILLVEDNPDDVVLILRALQKIRVQSRVVVAHDGEEACRLLFGPKPLKPEVVFLDLGLPKVSGLDVLKRIRNDENTKSMHVVIFTSSKEEEDILRGYGLGVNSFVRKPVNYDDFIEVIRSLGVYWLTEGQEK